MSVDETKNQIIITASQLFAKYGYYKTSIDNVAKMSRRAKGSIYYHFSTKEDLYIEVVSSEIEEIKKELEVIVSNKVMPADEKLKLFLKQRMLLLSRAKNYHETLHAEFFNELLFLKEVREEWDLWVKEKVRSIITQGINEEIFDTIPQLNSMLDVFIMVSRGLEIPFFLQDKYKEMSICFDGMLKMLIKGLKK